MLHVLRLLKEYERCNGLNLLIRGIRTRGLQVWDDIDFQKRFLAEAADKLKIKDKEDWYKVKPDDLFKLAGESSEYLRSKYSGLISKVVRTLVDPNHLWLAWRFQHERLPNGFWTHDSTLKAFLDDVQTRLKIHSPEDWYSVSRHAIL